MLVEWVTWWAEQMGSLLPLKRLAERGWMNAAVIRPAGAQLLAATRRHGVETALGPLHPGGPVLRRLREKTAGRLVLALPDGALLQQTVNLPLAAERDLAAVLAHEMDRLTPFPAADVYWTWRVLARDHATGQLRLRLLLVAKAAAQQSLAALQTMGLRPGALEAGAERLSLAPPGAAASRLRRAKWMGGLCAALALALIAVPVARQAWALSQVDDQIAALEPRIKTVESIRGRMAAAAKGAHVFGGDGARVGNALRALAAVTAALPDDAYLTAFSMRDHTLALAGRAAAAAKLIGQLSASPDLRDPAFDAPVTRIGAQSDQFSIRVSLAP